MMDIHRYYELKHFCLQYPQWACKFNDGFISAALPNGPVSNSYAFLEKPTEKTAIENIFYSSRMEMIKKAAQSSCGSNWKYPFKAAIYGVTYDYLKANTDITVDEKTFKNLYLEFFMALDILRK